MPGFEAETNAANALRAVLAMHWGVREKMVDSMVRLEVNPTLPVGKVVTLNSAAQDLLQTLGLLSMALL